MNVLIGACLFSVVSTVLLLLLTKRRKRSVPVNEGEAGCAQDLVQLADFDGALAVRKDGARVAFLAIEGKNLTFLTEEQRDLATTELEAAFAATDHPFSIHRVTKPVDTSENLAVIKRRLDFARCEAEAAAEVAALAKTERGSHAAYRFVRAAKAARVRCTLIEEVYLARARTAENVFEVETYVTLIFRDPKTAHADAQKAVSAFERRFFEAGYLVRQMRPSEVISALENYYGRYLCAAESQEIEVLGGKDGEIIG